MHEIVCDRILRAFFNLHGRNELSFAELLVTGRYEEGQPTADAKYVKSAIDQLIVDGMISEAPRDHNRGSMYCLEPKGRAFIARTSYMQEKQAKKSTITLFDIGLLTREEKSRMFGGNYFEGEDLYREDAKTKNITHAANEPIAGTNTRKGSWFKRNAWWIIPAITALIVGLIILFLSIQAHLRHLL